MHLKKMFGFCLTNNVRRVRIVDTSPGFTAIESFEKGWGRRNRASKTQEPANAAGNELNLRARIDGKDRRAHVLPCLAIIGSGDQDIGRLIRAIFPQPTKVHAGERGYGRWYSPIRLDLIIEINMQEGRGPPGCASIVRHVNGKAQRLPERDGEQAIAGREKLWWIGNGAEHAIHDVEIQRQILLAPGYASIVRDIEQGLEHRPPILTSL